HRPILGPQHLANLGIGCTVSTGELQRDVEALVDNTQLARIVVLKLVEQLGERKIAREQNARFEGFEVEFGLVRGMRIGWLGDSLTASVKRPSQPLDQ
ncbi:MAG: hypothetical protein V3T15_10905, partial [Pseudomonadales bacterium]